MKKTGLVNWSDTGCFWDLEVLSDIYLKVKAYAESKGYKEFSINSIEDNTEDDPDNNRYDIELFYVSPKDGCYMYQKLLYLKGEIVDGITFHNRFSEFYDCCT